MFIEERTLLTQDVGSASFDIVIKICRKLEIDPLELAQGNIIETACNETMRRL